MQILEESNTRLVLRDRSVIFGIVIGVGAVLAVFTMVSVAGYGLADLYRRSAEFTLIELRIFMLAAIGLMGVAFASLGAVACLNTIRGITCAFDAEAATVTVTQPKVLRNETVAYPIYGVSHAFMETNEEIEACAVYLMLRTGQRIPLSTCSIHERAEAEALVDRIKLFLRRL